MSQIERKKHIIYILFRKLFIGKLSIRNDIYLQKIISAKWSSLETLLTSIYCWIFNDILNYWWSISLMTPIISSQKSFADYSHRPGFPHKPKEKVQRYQIAWYWWPIDLTVSEYIQNIFLSNQLYHLWGVLTLYWKQMSWRSIFINSDSKIRLSSDVNDYYKQLQLHK